MCNRAKFDIRHVRNGVLVAIPILPAPIVGGGGIILGHVVVFVFIFR